MHLRVFRRASSTSSLTAAILQHSISKRRSDLLGVCHRVIDERSSPRLYQPRRYGGDNSDAEAKEIFGSEPYWPFCWAGGYALSRHLIAKRDELFSERGTVMIDLGCGGGICGLSAIVASSSSPDLHVPRVIFNDIDEAALIAARLNLEETVRQTGIASDCLHHAVYEQRSLLGVDLQVSLETVLFLPDQLPPGRRRLIVACGDVLYSLEMGKEILRTLGRLVCLPRTETTVLIGDPGRHAFTELVVDAEGTNRQNFLSSLGLRCNVVGAYRARAEKDDDENEANIEGVDGFEAAEGGEIQVVELSLAR